MPALPFALVAIVCYLAAGLWQSLSLARRVAERPGWVRGAGLIALVCHGVIVGLTILGPRGLHLGLTQSAALVGWLVVALLLAASLVKPVLNAGVCVFPLAAITVVAVIGMPSTMTESGVSPGLYFHILTSIAAFSFLAIAAVQAVLVACQHQALKRRQTGGIVQVLPPLTRMEQLLFELIWCGMLLLTVAIVSGFVFVDNLFAQHLAHKTILSLLAWLIFAGLLAGHHYLGWRGPKAVRWTLVGVGVLILAFFGTKFVLEYIFHYNA
ncbi:cytochrome C assembly family protein [Salinicola rhizosphaerae]|uniref:Inner membrane protein YpjD n=1 Tax=Salinicola rhizosphaerae TaxID=1443141 RepID=A0ABQ3E1S0_9GAMM|nr:cytochrome c biogenesis protein CcsA [Salinicola rhizosphaerae]GHB16990.1 inner membrane protein YpjD [Salinicola rhizosphaerae]